MRENQKLVTFRYAWRTLPSHTKMLSCIVAGVCAVVFIVGLIGAAGVFAAKPNGGVSAKLAFILDKDGGYRFDTGILRGQLRQGGKGLGLSSVKHIPSGVRLDGAFGILSFYRVFTTNKRYGTAAWDWPSESKLLPDGAVQIIWPAAEEKPFQMLAVYRWKDSSTLDLETIIKPQIDLGNFEVFLASYFQKIFPSPYVCVAANPQAEGKLGFLLASKSFGDWQMFPRNKNVLPIVQDGRWQKEPNPVNWVIMPQMFAPICLRRGAATDVVVVLMSPSEDCFAIATPYEGESHYSLYLSLFGRDIKAGETAKARSRFVVTTAISDRQILDLYQNYAKELIP